MSANNPNKAISLEQIHAAHEQLFPNEFEFLVLYHLHVNYSSTEIRYAEIKQAIVDTSRLPFIYNGKDRQIEKTLKDLLRGFLERDPAKPNTYLLTLHTEKIIDIAVQRINNPYLAFPLKDTFEEYFELPANADEGINHLQSWHKFGFQNNARQVVTAHLEGLKLSVDDAIKALNLVLEADHLSAIQMLEQFSSNFQILGEKARQIAEAITMKVSVHYKLRDIVSKYSERTLNEESSYKVGGNEYEMLRQDRQEAARIREDVSAFFDKVDQQLDLINMKMAFASSKVTELQETLRAHSHYKISLKKMLVYLLENSKPNDQYWIKLPEKFPVRSFVQQKFRFGSLRYYDMGFLKRATPFEQSNDEAYEADERQRFESDLATQFTIQRHYEAAQRELDLSEHLDLSKYALGILQRGDGLEVGVQTAYEIIRNLTDEDLEIKEELQSNDTNDLHLWKVTVRKNPSSVS